MPVWKTTQDKDAHPCYVVVGTPRRPYLAQRIPYSPRFAQQNLDAKGASGALKKAQLEEHFQELFSDSKITIHLRTVPKFAKYPYDYQIIATVTDHPLFAEVKALFE